MAAAAPASDCISTTLTGCPKIFFLPCADHSSTPSAIGVDGVIGYIDATSVKAYAAVAAALLPSIVSVFIKLLKLPMVLISLLLFQHFVFVIICPRLRFKTLLQEKLCARYILQRGINIIIRQTLEKCKNTLFRIPL